MDFKQLQSYVAVVESQSFTKAAERLFVSQPTISAHIRALEGELKTPLIVRTTKSIEITPKGRTVYEHALSILRIRESMIQDCAMDQKQIIHIAASTIPSAYMLPQILTEYGRLHPQVYFSIYQCKSRNVLEGVAAGRFDLGLSTTRGDERVVSLPVCRDRMVFITPVSHEYLRLLDEDDEAAFNVLICQPIILREKREGEEKLVDRYLAALGIEEKELEIVARANDQETVKNLVAGGMGVSLISYRAARNFIEEKRVLCFELPIRSEKEIYLIAGKNERQKDHLRTLAHYIQSKYERE